ncbi:hypothetical protein ATB93_14825 [Sphingomonas sp. WG]|nr:hypothetical protein ATB93_14825 [Sphingomonas sp. WG]
MRAPAHAASGAAAPRRAPGVAEARVVALLTGANRPISAYDIVHRCTAEGHPIAPTQVYRVLARLMAQGRVFRVETLAAYMLWRAPFDMCLICDGCHAIQLLPCPELPAQLAAQAQRLGFRPARLIIESHGRCAECATTLQ